MTPEEKPIPTDGLTLRVLGGMEISVDGSPIEVDTRKAIALLTYLAVTDSAASRDHLSTLLWGGLDAGRARSALRRTLSVLRRSLADRWLESDGDRIRLRGERWLDMEVAETLRASVTGHGHDRDAVCPECLAPLEEAAALYRGGFMEGFSLRDCPDFEMWQLQQGDVIRHRHTSALRMLADAAALQRDYERAVATARQRVTVSPLDEGAHRQLMLMQVWAGDRAGALRQYRECVRILDEELGVPPLPETSQLEDRILCDDIPEPPATAPPAHIPDAPAAEGPGRSELVGRSQEMAALRSLIEQPGGRVAAITGNPGVGKSRLAEEAASWATGRSRLVAGAKAYEGEHDLPLVLVGEALRAALDGWESPPVLEQRVAVEASRLLPELAPAGGAQPAAPDPGGQSRFLDGVCTALATLLGEGGVLILDDLHWADSASLDLLAYLVRRPSRFPICTILIWRAPPGPSHPLRTVVEEQVEQGNGLIVDLAPLSTEEVKQLAAHLHPEISEESSQRVADGSAGNPLIALQYLRMLDPATGDLPLAGAAHTEITETRLRGVTELGRQILAATSIIGRAFDESDVRVASGRSDEESAAGVDELLDAGILFENEDGLFDFTHDLVRHEVRESLSAVRRRLLHGRLADHLVRRFKSDGANAGRIAHHLEAAGRLEEAGRYRSYAGDQARSVFAHHEAMTHYQAALGLGHAETGRIQTSIGDLHTLAGDYTAALDAYRSAAARATGVELAEIEHRLGEINGRLGRWELALHHFRSAAAGLEDPDRLIDLHVDWARTCRRMGDEEGARTRVAEAVALAESNAGAIPPMVAIMEGLFDEDAATGEERVERGLELARNRADPGAEATALTALALLARRQGEASRAIERAETALALVSRIGDRHRQATLHDLLADLFHEIGDEANAMVQLTRAVELFAEVGTGGLEPAIWKTTPW